MNKQRILELTGMSEDQFYDAYPDQESFCSDYPEACAQLQQAQGGMQTYNREQPLDVISPLVARYTLPKGMVDNSKPIEKMTVPRQVMSPKQTMYNVGSTGTSYITPIDTEYKNGGNWIKKAIKHPGRCTPGSPNYDCPKGSPQWNLAQTFKKHHGFHEKGGELEEYQGGSQVNYNLPTAQDSLNVMNSQLKLNQFYDNERKLGRLKFNYKIPFRKKQSYSSNELNNKNLKFYRDAIKRRQDYNDSGYDEEYKKLFNLSPSDVSRLEYQGLSKTKSGNNNVQYYRDLVTLKQNLASPFAMYDDRIEPQNIISYDPIRGNGTRYPGGLVKLYDYDPIVVKPAAMKTQADWEYIKKNYPNLPNNSKIKIQPPKLVSLPSLQEMQLKQQKGTIPMYGPSGSIIAWHDNEGYVYPTIYYGGAPNQYDKRDLEFINNPDKVKEYFSKKDGWYKFKDTSYEEGGTNIFPAMRNFKHGGYYGMDGKFHPNSDSGTYVGGAGYYFETGGGSTSSAAGSGMAAGAATATASAGAASTTGQSSFASNEAWKKDDVNGGYLINTDYDPKFGEDDNNNKQFGEDADEKNIKDYDASMYSSEIDPNTGFRKWSYNNQEIRNIKKDNPALWEHLKEEGHGARWETGQTDIQKVGRTAGAIGRGLENAVNVAGAIGNYLSNRQKQQNLDKAAMNMGSTASMFTNPEGSSKGDYGVTGSAYGMFKPNQTGNYSFKGMYGKYGMEVPKYQSGGGFQNLFSSSQLLMPIVNPLEFRDNSYSLNSPSYTINKNRSIDGPIDVDLALQAVSGHESGVKPGQTKVGFRTRLIGESGKRATASGTYQITTDTLKQIFKNDKNLRSNFKTFNEFKSAFDTNPDVEYAAARSLMSDHIKNYGVYALGAWYQPAFAKRAMEGDKSVFNIVPRKDYGNKLKWGVDFKNKLNSYNKLAGTDYKIMKYGGQQLGGQVVEMDENEIQQFLKAGGQLEFID